MPESLSNLFLHYQSYLDGADASGPSVVSYADDGLVHCRSEAESPGLTSNFKRVWQSAAWSASTKTKVVDCHDRIRRGA